MALYISDANGELKKIAGNYKKPLVPILAGHFNAGDYSAGAWDAAAIGLTQDFNTATDCFSVSDNHININKDGLYRITANCYYVRADGATSGLWTAKISSGTWSLIQNHWTQGVNNTIVNDKVERLYAGDRVGFALYNESAGTYTLTIKSAGTVVLYGFIIERVGD